MAGALLAGFLPVVMSSEVYAMPYAIGEIEGSVDTTVSYGRLWRVQAQDKNNDVITDNDGNRSFKPGLVSEVFKVTSEAQASYENVGAFIRGTAFYDTQIMDKRNNYLDGNLPAQPSQNYPHDSSYSYDTRHTAGRNAEILDAYVYGSWDIADHAVTAKLGKQVFSWGEGLFYRGGINTTNPVDAAKYHVPGSEVKEALVPIEAINFNISLTDNLSMETFYQWNWKETAIDPAGTYYSDSDLFAAGGRNVYVGVDDPAVRSLLGAFPIAAQLGLVGNGPAGVNNYINASQSIFSAGRVGSDLNAKNEGQYGLSFRYIAEELNQTEFGFYYVNYHAKEPLIALDLDGYKGVDLSNPLWALFPSEAIPGLATLDLGANATVRREYAEDIRMYGVSFNTTVAETSVFGELSYRPNMPISISSSGDILGDILGQGFNGLSNAYDSSVPDSQACFTVGGQQLCRDKALHNYERVEMFNTSLGAIYKLDQMFSFDSLALVGEVASEHVRGSSLKYNVYDGSARSYTGTKGTMTRDAYGYTAVVSGTWNDVFGGINLSPYVVFKHDFKGTSHLTGAFLEDSKAFTAGLKAVYLDSLETELSYTSYFGAKDVDSMHDRDNVGLNVKYSF